MDIAERYRRAEAVQATKLADKTLNERVVANWIGPSAFWYRRDLAPGKWEHVLVDGNGTRRTAFDHARLAAAAGAALGTSLNPESLPVTAIRLDDGGSVTLTMPGGALHCTLKDCQCRLVAVEETPSSMLPSPDGRLLAFTRDHDLWVKEVQTGQERRLTEDGSPLQSWGQYHDGTLLSIVRQRSGLPFPPFGSAWSPDSRKLIGFRVDERGIEPYPFVESVPQDGSFRPIVHNVRQPLLGEPSAPQEVCVIDVTTGTCTRVEQPDQALLEGPLAWSKGAVSFFALAIDLSCRSTQLVEIDAASGTIREILSESAATRVNLNSEMYNTPNVRFIRDASQVLWFSERTGWGHLYRYDVASGALLNALTSGPWLVKDIIRVDAARGTVFFTGLGREAGNPYFRKLYRVDLDGSNLTLLTPEDSDHLFDGNPSLMMKTYYQLSDQPAMISPDCSVFIDTCSTLDTAPITRLRSAADGQVICTLEKTDAGAVYAAGWQAPQPFMVKAADGVTDLHGAIYFPRHVAPGEKRPVIDSIYGGPQVAVAPHNFSAAISTRNPAGGGAEFSQLGFFVVVLDARGTTRRSKAFQDIGYGNFADPGLADHVAALKQLGERFPGMDLQRVGICGHSFGGYVSARAMLRYPEFFKVCVSSAGIHNFHNVYPIGQVQGPPDYGNGETRKPNRTAVPGNYRSFDNHALVENLQGKLLLVYGDMDENVLQATTLQFVDALIRANRDYDLLYLPNRRHSFGSDPYFVRRRWDYFVEHLAGMTPPANYQIAGEPALQESNEAVPE